MTELHLLALTNGLVFSRICYQLFVEVGHDLVFGKLKNWKREAVFFIPEKPSVNISFQLGCSVFSVRLQQTAHQKLHFQCDVIVGILSTLYTSVCLLT